MIPNVALLAVVLAASPAPPAELSTEFWQVSPEKGEKMKAVAAKAAGVPRAVVLIPGLHVHPLRPSRATRPDHRPWQEPTSELVKALAQDSHVFAFAYAQTVPVDMISRSEGLRNAISQIRKAGYKEVVLIGHSAGGIIARQFVEQYPDSGVTKVITVAAPFTGSEAATFKIGYPKVQAPFVHSLTPDARTQATKMKAHALGKDVDFACVVCKLKRAESDGVVFIRSQWPEDLQRLGVPAVLATVSHLEAMQSAETAKTIAKLVREKLIHWSPDEVEKARKILFGEPKMK